MDQENAIVRPQRRRKTDNLLQNMVTFADSNTPPVIACNTSPANLANPENETKEAS